MRLMARETREKKQKSRAIDVETSFIEWPPKGGHISIFVHDWVPSEISCIFAFFRGLFSESLRP
jgi:hypothetical protein